MDSPAPQTAAIPKITAAPSNDLDDFFDVPEDTTFVVFPRLSVGLGLLTSVYADGSYVHDWTPPGH